MCDPSFKGMSWATKRLIARNISIARCGQLPLNSIPAERTVPSGPRILTGPSGPRVIIENPGGDLIEVPDN
jgi:hypothetical protein